MTARKFPQLMTTAEVAAAFRVDVATVNRWGREGKLRVFTLPGGGHNHHRWYRTQVEALIAGEPLTGAELDAVVRGEL